MGHNLRTMAALVGALIAVFWTATATGRVQAIHEPRAPLALSIGRAQGVMNLDGLMEAAGCGPGHHDPDVEGTVSGRLVFDSGVVLAASLNPASGGIQAGIIFGDPRMARACLQCRQNPSSVPAGSTEMPKAPVRMHLVIGREHSARISVGF